MPIRESNEAVDGSTRKSVEILRMTPDQAIRNESDPEVRLYPTIGYSIADGSLWRIQIQGRISQTAPATFGKRLMLRGLIRALSVSSQVAEGDLFRQRVRGFISAPVAGTRVQVELAGQNYVLRRKSKASGLFNCKLDISSKQMQNFKTYGVLPYRIDCQDLDCVQKWDVGFGKVSSQVFLAERRGFSVVTDIDDTIKLTEVNSRKRMLLRTFAEPFEAIEGMASAYQRWAEQGALFHYVSSSPWQIYDALNQFLVDEHFPLGSMHLKWFRLRDEIFKRWQIIRRKSKGGVIRTLIKRLPGRTFILVGDSGERDPEIYAKLASKFPSQVARICIRQIDANPLNGNRLNRIYRRYGMTVPIQVFANPAQLGDIAIP
ncbi:MAG TPA: phosphatase domain-containing protein [Pirellula sp.]|nr:phosphatase domain-containing protein [Pirellula sp.]